MKAEKRIGFGIIGGALFSYGVFVLQNSNNVGWLGIIMGVLSIYYAYKG